MRRNSAGRSQTHTLNLRSGEWVEVRSAAEILATLDEHGKLDAMPFMPEMLKHCGRRLRVAKSAHKTCDTISYQGARKLERTVHLENTRCDGAFHGGCQAGCTFFWKDAWLKRVVDVDPAPVDDLSPRGAGVCTEQTLLDATCAREEPGRADAAVAVRYSCQATELNRASVELPWWDLRQYVKDVSTGNVPVSRVLGAFGFWLFTKLLRVGAWRALVWTYDSLQRMRGGVPYPYKYGSCERTPVERLGLVPGELVTVKSQEQILRTVNARNRNRGLSFDEEMVEFCGGTYPVLRRVERIINERTGEMMMLKGDCIVLDGVTCNSRFKSKRLFCPRALYPFWREIWLQRSGMSTGDSSAGAAAETAK